MAFCFRLSMFSNVSFIFYVGSRKVDIDYEFAELIYEKWKNTVPSEEDCIKGKYAQYDFFFFYVYVK